MSHLEAEPLSEACEHFLSEAEDMEQTLVEWRRTFHQFPELGMEEHITSTKIEEILSELPGVEVFKGFGLPTCVIARIGGDIPGGAIALRAEIDAVEVKEDTGLPFSSFDDGVSHVQGHDAHIATVLGVAALLSQHVDMLRAPVVLIFQPGEEGRGGARLLIEAGVIEEFSIEKMICLHWVPELPYGKIFTKKGGTTAFSSKVHIGLSGQGGHGSTPHLAADPLFLSAQLQIALQTLITREVSSQKSAVLSFGRIEAGESYNVIAEEAHLWGTLRSDDKKTMDYLKTRIEELTKGYARTSRLAAAVEYMLNYSQVQNDDALVSNVFTYGAALFGSDTIELLKRPLLYGEDLSFFTERVPSCLMFLGTGMEYGLYHARYDIPENLLPFAAAWCAYMAIALQ